MARWVRWLRRRATATSVSDRVELYLVPAGKHAGKDAPQGQVDRMTASGHVVLSSPGTARDRRAVDLYGQEPGSMC